MNIEDFRDFCLSLNCVTEEFPFDNNTLVFKVAGKMFALTGIEEFNGVNLKCDPEKAVDLREQYPAVQPGFHMNKKHWNTVQLDGSISNELLQEWIQDSYWLVIKKLPKKIQKELAL